MGRRTVREASGINFLAFKVLILLGRVDSGSPEGAELSRVRGH